MLIGFLLTIEIINDAKKSISIHLQRNNVDPLHIRVSLVLEGGIKDFKGVYISLCPFNLYPLPPDKILS